MLKSLFRPFVKTLSVSVFALAATASLALADAHAPSYFDGLDAMRNDNPARAYEIWQQLADDGDSSSQYSLGLLLETGQGPIQADLDSALRYYQMAADAGVAEAQTNLGLLYAEGRGVNRNPELAVEFWAKSAAAGHAMGLFNLGLAYYQGTGVGKNQAEATALIFEAALLGQREAQFALGQFYRFGLGVAKSEPEALYWYQLAAAQDHIQAAQFSDDLSGSGILAAAGPTADLTPGAPTTIEMAPPVIADVMPSDEAPMLDEQVAAVPVPTPTPAPTPAPAPAPVLAPTDQMASELASQDEVTPAFNLAEEDLSEQFEEIDSSAAQMAETVARRNAEDNLPVDVAYLTENEAENAFREALVLFQNPDGDRVINGRRAVMKLYNSAISGNAKAMRSLGELYLLGLDLVRDDRQALYWLRLAESNGIADINGFADVLEMRGIESPARPDAAPMFVN